jgi:hypothetical protein
LTDSGVARVVPSLEPETIQHMIRSRGLEACEEIIGAATPAQLTSVFDIELWRHSRPGHDEDFDEERFAEWLEALAGMSDSEASRVFASIDRQLLIAGLSRHVRVFDVASLVQIPSDDEPLNPGAFSSALTSEIGGYVVVASQPTAWDAIVSLLIAVEAGCRECFDGVMAGCRRLSNSTPEVDGLDALLPAPEQLLFDVKSVRDERRAQRGYVPVADGRAFLEMARRPTRSPHLDSRNPIAAAHISFDIASGPSLLEEPSRVPRERPKALLASGDEPAARFPRLREMLDEVRARDESAYLSRLHELAFLANAIQSGCSVLSRSFTPQEASEAAAATCNLGLDLPDSPLPELLVHRDLIGLFELGWSALYEHVSMSVARRLEEILEALESVDVEIQADLTALRRALVRATEAGAPWRACGSLDVIAILDLPAWISLTGLLSECPVLPRALTAVLDRRSDRVDANAFDVISTWDDIGRAQAFMRRLPGMLIG